LGAVNALGGARESAGFDDGDEAAQQLKIQHRGLHSFFH
jgi:hypothetical protein